MFIGGVGALVALPVSSATRSGVPTRVLTRRKTTALQGSEILEGCADQCVLVEPRIEEVGFPGAGHSGLLRSRGGTWGLEKVPHPTRAASGKSSEIPTF